MSAASAARVYLDVDGVINAVTRGYPSWGWGEVRRAVVNGYPITYAPEFVTLINEVAASPAVDVFWLTTWEHDAPKMLAPALGIDGTEWPVVGTEHHYSHELTHGWWKLHALRDHLEDFGGPVLWVDDDISFDRDARDWLADHPSVVALSPTTSLGVTKRQGGIFRRFVTDIALPTASP